MKPRLRVARAGERVSCRVENGVGYCRREMKADVLIIDTGEDVFDIAVSEVREALKRAPRRR